MTSPGGPPQGPGGFSGPGGGPGYPGAQVAGPPSGNGGLQGEVHTLERAIYEVKRIIVGQDRLVERMLVGLLSKGHVLLEGVPVQEVNRLLKQFLQMERVMKQMKGGGLKRLLRGLAGALLWLLGMLLGLVAVVLCVTIILLPLGILLFKPARRLIDRAIRLMLPRPVANPAASMKRGSKKARGKAKDAAPDLGVDTKKLRKKARKTKKKGRKSLGRAKDKVGV